MNLSPITTKERVIRICLYLFAFIAIMGGVLQMSMGEPETTPRLDNIHRFLAGVYLGCGFICGWAGSTVREHGTLVYLIALTGFLGGTGRLISMQIVGVPEPAAVWYGYAAVELFVPVIMVLAQRSR